MEDLILAGAAATGNGNALNNFIDGNELANVLNGAGGNDTLSGEGGDDTLIGGDGADRYVYTLGDGRDVIIDDGSASEANLLTLAAIDRSSLRFYRVSSATDDLVIGVSDGGSVTLRNFLSGAHAAIDGIRFDSGPQMSRAELEALAASAPVLATAPPTAVDDPSLMIATPVAVIQAAALLANDLSPSGLPLHIISIDNVAGGAVTLRGDGDLDLTAGFASDLVNFDYTVSDGLGGTSTATAVIELAGNHAPIAAGTLVDQTGNEDTPFSLALAGSLFTDSDFDPLTFAATLNGGAALPTWLHFDADTGVFNGTPPAAAAGHLDIVVTASDGLAFATAGFRLDVRRLNHAPIAAADSIVAEEGLPLTIAGASLTANDVDADSDLLAIASVGAATHGTASVTTNGSVLFTPDAGYTGAASFNYTVDDGNGGSATGIVALMLTASAGRGITGTAGNDVLTGTTGADTIEGAAGDDILLGLAGDDVFRVTGLATGYDIFSGGAGIDRILGSAADDLIGLQNVAGALSSIELIDGGAGTDALRGTAGNDVIDLTAIGITGIELIDGAAGDDLIIGSGGNDTIRGGVGFDTLRGGAGDDTFLFQGTANGVDVVAGGAGYDKILGSAAADTIMLNVSAENFTGLELIDMGAGNDQILGSPGNDFYDLSAMLISGLELFDAGLGNDTIIGGQGNDTLKGGAGNDVFAFRRNGGHHTILDFALGTTAAPIADLIDFSAFGFGSFNSVMGRVAASGTTDTLITLDAANDLKLIGVKPSQLKTDDFKLA